MLRASFLFLSCLSALVPVPAALKAHPAHGEQAPSGAAPSQTPARRIMVETSEGPVPWNHLKFHNDPNDFQFAIVTDRTGGHRDGIFESAVTRLNWLQPEFVMSVGDLIEGYTEDTSILAQQWNEFQGFISKLEMPFFYVAGNHDYTNAVMAEEWAKRFGKSYYSFIYRDALFVCLNSQRPKMHHLDEGQIAWLKETLKTHADARWTFVFLHTPLWEKNYDPEATLWGQAEAALQGRKFTVFAGHHHNYVQNIRNDRRFITLATTGGASQLRGPQFGEFDQVAWVTLTPQGPVIANLMLEGILPQDVVTAESQKAVRDLAQSSSVWGEPIFFEGAGLSQAKTRLRFTNNFDVPMHLQGILRAEPGIEVKGAGNLEKKLQPNSVELVDLEISTAPNALQGREILPLAALDWTVKLPLKGKPGFELPGRSKIAAVKRRFLDRAAAPISADGQLDEWKSEKIPVGQPGQILHQAASWKGPSDCGFILRFCQDDAFLYAALEVTDNECLAEPQVLPWEQDGVEIRIDARGEKVRNMPPAPKEFADILFFALSPNDGKSTPWVMNPEKIPPGCSYACVRTKQGYNAEIAIPLAALKKWGAEPWKSLRINVAVNDKDRDGQSQLWWQPDWRTGQNVPGSGTFLKRTEAQTNK